MFLVSVGPTCRGNLTLDLEVCGYIFLYVVQPDLRYMYGFVYFLDIRRLRQISGSWLWAKQFRRVQKWGQKNILSGKWSLRGLWRRWMDLWALSPCLRGLALGLRPKGHVFQFSGRFLRHMIRSASLNCFFFLCPTNNESMGIEALLPTGTRVSKGLLIPKRQTSCLVWWISLGSWQINKYMWFIIYSIVEIFESKWFIWARGRSPPTCFPMVGMVVKVMGVSLNGGIPKTPQNDHL